MKPPNRKPPVRLSEREGESNRVSTTISQPPRGSKPDQVQLRDCPAAGTGVNENALINCALAFAVKGKAVFPCKPDKKPFTAHGFLDASTDPERIRSWWAEHPGANVGTPTGAVTGTVVLDVDCDETKQLDGEAALAELVEQHEALPRTLTIKTPRGGRHLYFKHPGTRVPNSTCKLGAGLDVRGDGGYTLLPPSKTDRGAYVYLDRSPMAELPEWLRDLMLNGAAGSAARNKTMATGKAPFNRSTGPGVPRTESDLETDDTAELSIIVLPSGAVSISESARAIFQRIAPSMTLFWRGGALVELVEQDGATGLEVIRADAFRSRVERYSNIFAWRSDGEGNPVLKRTKMPRDDAVAIMATAEAREILPPIASVLRCPVLVESSEGGVTILARGYHSELGGLLIVAGDEPPRVELSEAVASLKWLVEETLFQSEGDRSRALAAYITPALRLGGFFNGNIPMDVAEADDSQAGKGYRQRMVALLYNEIAYPVTQRDGGVGSFDESFGTALVAARPFITLENVRGRLASQHIEGFLTSPEVFNGLFVARVPGVREQTVNSRRFLIQLSSNGLESTIDLANRASICRIRKRYGFTYRNTREELQQRQSYFLGCVFAVIAEWIANGKPRTNDTRHDFREWSQTLDWICQNVLDCAPLIDGHQAAQERVSNPALSWVRSVALLVESEGRLCKALIASELAELCHRHERDIPGVMNSDEDRARRQVGVLMRRVFKEGDEISVEGYAVSRGQKEYRKPSGDMDFTPTYTFKK